MSNNYHQRHSTAINFPTTHHPHLRHNHHRHISSHTSSIFQETGRVDDESSLFSFNQLSSQEIDSTPINVTVTEFISSVQLNSYSSTELLPEQYSNSSLFNISAVQNDTAVDDRRERLRDLYAVMIPIMMIFVIITVTFNMIIVAASRWCRKPMSPTLYFSISLALADAYASFIVGAGLIINSYIPVVLQEDFPKTACLPLTLEAFRLSGVLVACFHLLALAINHWIGIVRPLHYRLTMTRRIAWTIITLSWLSPISILLLAFGLVPGQGFQSKECAVNHFLSRLIFRGCFAVCLFGPLILMTFFYTHIFITVRRQQAGRELHEGSSPEDNQQMRRNVKAAWTTVLILGTYIIGWMPANVHFIMVCDECLYKLEDVPYVARYGMGITFNTLLILKVFVDPIIYAARMNDIQSALRKMKYEFLKLFFGRCLTLEDPTIDERKSSSSRFRSIYKNNRSVRINSIPSCTRRTNSTAAIYASNNSTTYTGVMISSAIQPKEPSPALTNSSGSQANGNGSTYTETFEMTAMMNNR